MDIDLSTLDYIALCDPVELLTLDLRDVTEVRGHRTKSVCVTAHQSLPLTAVVYWFEVKLCDRVEITTTDKRTHWKQAAVMFHNEVELEENCLFLLETVYSDSCINISIEPSINS